MTNDEKLKIYQLIADRQEYSWKERLAHKIIWSSLKDFIIDLIDDFRGNGFGDGYSEGFKQAQTNFKQGQIDLYEQGRADGAKQYLSQLRAVNPDNVFKIEVNGQGIPTGRAFLGEKIIESNEVSVLREEARILKEFKLWSIFKDTLTEQAKRVMFEKSESFDDMKYGKAILFCVDLEEGIRLRAENYQTEDKKVDTKPFDYGNNSSAVV